jgi:hypothetical protein
LAHRHFQQKISLPLFVFNFRLQVAHLDPGACLLKIWRCHWSLIFSDVPFLLSSASSHVSFLISRASQEHLLQQGLSPFSLPHFYI